MLLVRIELWPGGRPHRIQEIGLLRIGNVSDLADVSDYEYVLEGDANERLGIEAIHVNGEVQGLRRSDNAWKLVQRTLNDAFPDTAPYGSTFDDFLEDHGIKDEVHAEALESIKRRRLELHRRWALQGAHAVLKDLQSRGADARLVGSLARGEDFGSRSDIDILVMSAREEVDQRLEFIVEDLLGVGMESGLFSVIRLEYVRHPHWRDRLLRDALSLEQLPPIPPALPPLVFSEDELPEEIREGAACEPVILTKAGRPHSVVMSVREFDRLRDRSRTVDPHRDPPEDIRDKDEDI